jgi:hypothetical protein
MCFCLFFSLLFTSCSLWRWVISFLGKNKPDLYPRVSPTLYSSGQPTVKLKSLACFSALCKKKGYHSQTIGLLLSILILFLYVDS